MTWRSLGDSNPCFRRESQTSALAKRLIRHIFSSDGKPRQTAAEAAIFGSSLVVGSRHGRDSEAREVGKSERLQPAEARAAAALAGLERG